MAKFNFKKGTTSKIVHVFIQDATQTNGAGLTGLLYNTSGLTAYYFLEGATSAVAISLSAGSLGTWSSGGFVAVDGTNLPGMYELGLPNAALTGANSVKVMLKGAANMIVSVMEIQLDATDNQDAVRGGMSALPNANASAAGGLPTFGSGAGQINPDGSGNVPIAPGQAVPATPTANTTGAALFYAANKIGRTNTAQGGTSSTITLDSGASATDNSYNGHFIKLTGGTGAGQFATITGYVGTTKVATITRPGVLTWSTTPDATTTFFIEPVWESIVYSNLDKTGYTAATVQDKTGYALASSEHTQIQTDAATGILVTPGNKLATNSSGQVTTTYPIRANTAFPNFTISMVSSTDHVTPKTGAAVTGQVALNGGAFANLTNAVSEVGSGAYKINLAAGDLNGTDVMLRFTANGADPVVIKLILNA